MKSKSTQKIIIVLDCGATNVRSVAVNEKGKIIAIASTKNNTQPDPYYVSGLIWDVDEIWMKLVNCTKEVLSKIDKNSIAGITITTFGVDVAPVLKSGKLLYPVISWACLRTVPVMENIEKYIPFDMLYSINGIHKFSFNTINKLIWFNENKPEILDQADYFATITSIFNHRLTEEFCTDTTMAGTTMLTDISSRSFSEEIFKAIGIENKFPRLVEPGKIIGRITKRSSAETGLPMGTPVIATGHDTQFAIFGSGVAKNQPVLSSGTWEILMARTAEISTGTSEIENGITNEFDAIKGLYNPGIQWLGSGILEKIKNRFYNVEARQFQGDELYELMIKEAEKTSVDINFKPELLNDPEIDRKFNRGDIYYSALFSMANRTKKSLKLLEESGSFKAESLLVVGGGSKNRLWNKLRAEITGLTVQTIEQKEATVLGAAMFAFAGNGVYKSPEEARANFNYTSRKSNP